MNKSIWRLLFPMLYSKYHYTFLIIRQFQSINTSICFTIIIFYMRPRFCKNYTEWFNFLIIIYVTNEVHIIFLTRRNLTRYYQNLHPLKNRILLTVKFTFFSFNITKYFFINFLYIIKKIFIMNYFFHSYQYFLINLRLCSY